MTAKTVSFKELVTKFSKQWPETQFSKLQLDAQNELIVCWLQELDCPEFYAHSLVRDVAIDMLSNKFMGAGSEIRQYSSQTQLRYAFKESIYFNEMCDKFEEIMLAQIEEGERARLDFEGWRKVVEEDDEYYIKQGKTVRIV